MTSASKKKKTHKKNQQYKADRSLTNLELLDVRPESRGIFKCQFEAELWLSSLKSKLLSDSGIKLDVMIFSVCTQAA